MAIALERLWESWVGLVGVVFVTEWDGGRKEWVPGFSGGDMNVASGMVCVF